MKQTVKLFGLYMLNRWGEDEARCAFADAPCGWEYVWDKYAAIAERRGVAAAALEFFFSLDGNLQQMFCDHIASTYNG